MQLAKKQLFLKQTPPPYTHTKGYIRLEVWMGFTEEIPVSDSLLLIIDGSNDLFIHFASSLLCFPLYAWSGFQVGQRG